MRALPIESKMPKQLQKASCSPEDAWEEWMEWNPSIDSKSGQQLLSPRDTSSEHSHQQDGASSRAQSPVHGFGLSDGLTRKRKASDDVDKGGPKSRSQMGEPDTLQIRSHSLAEKRYRTNLNDKIAELSQSVPSLRDSSPAGAQGSAAAAKHNKATILTKAIEYIHLLEKRNAYLEDANHTLKHRGLHTAKADRDDTIDCEVKLPKSYSSVCDNLSDRDQASTTAKDGTIGVIPVPDDMRKLRDSVPPQGHYADQFLPTKTQETSASGKVSITGGRTIGKLMIGSLAGLMVIDSFVGNGKNASNDRGLLALPIDSILTVSRMLWMAFPARLASLPCSQVLVSLTRVFLILAILSMIMFLYLFNSKPKLGQVIVAPSERTLRPLASPMDMRQNAWLTAIQTVWVPRHTILPELVALILETHAYITRNILGWRSYSWLTNRDEEDEIARVRAWEIAIDAQLAGGDVELSRSRLVLTLWASGTLPNTPARLMLKALHLRILFWQASRYRRISEALNTIGRYLADKQWQLGLDLIENPTLSKDPNGSDPLPDHLVALLQQPIDEVMTDSTILRAHNLAWGGVPLESHGEREPGVHLEDTAMLGTLDTLAMWSSEFMLQEALDVFIEATGTHDSYQSQIELALRVAPPGSHSFFRALAATAIVTETDRRENVVTLSTALQPSNNFSFQASPPVTPSPPSAEFGNITVALDCASAVDLVGQSKDKPKALCQALQVLIQVLSKAESLDLLGLAAVYGLMHKISAHIDLAKQLALNFNEAVLGAITQLSKPVAYKSEKILQLQGTCKVAMKKLVLRNSKGRRMSNVSVDSGYGSMIDFNQDS